jgi:hypothetical protein
MKTYHLDAAECMLINLVGMVYILDQHVHLIKCLQVEICEFDVHTSLSGLKLGRYISLYELEIKKDAFWNKIQGCKEN